MNMMDMEADTDTVVVFMVEGGETMGLWCTMKL